MERGVLIMQIKIKAMCLNCSKEIDFDMDMLENEMNEFMEHIKLTKNRYYAMQKCTCGGRAVFIQNIDVHK